MQSNLHNGRINYTREKTGVFITLDVSDNLQKILSHFKENSVTAYIFPILNDFHQTPTQQKDRIKKTLKKLNSDLKLIASICGIDAKITSYVARHTFANTLLQKGIDRGRIGDTLGHKDKTSVNNYLKQFVNEELDQLDELL